MHYDEPIPKNEMESFWYELNERVVFELRKAFRKIKERDKITQRDIAKRIGRNPSFISRALSGETEISLKTAHKIARGMNHRLRFQLEDMSELPMRNDRPGSSQISDNATTPATAAPFEIRYAGIPI